MVNDPEIDAVVAHVEYPGGSYNYGSGRKVIFSDKEWRQMAQAAAGDSISVILYTRVEGQWRKHPSFSICISPDSIDPWVSYRLIEPSYVAYERIDICKHSLTTHDEVVMVSNHDSRMEGDGQCLNCHSYQNYSSRNMVYHVRGEGGGTMLIRDGKPHFMPKMRKAGMISNPVYPSWHPSLPLIAFSTNHTGQMFHTQSAQKIEVQDTESELVIYNVETDSMTIIPSADEDLENFPSWSADGRSLFYTSAHFVCQDSVAHVELKNKQREFANRHQEVRYDLYRRPVDLSDPNSPKAGEPELLIDAAAQAHSVTLPRVSPDGRYLAYAWGPYGCFHIWHHDADIRVLDLETREVLTLAEANSQRAESYPTWSSNGRWLFMASRRDDGNYSRVYISYFSSDGKAHKAFALPHADPEHDLQLLRSYNRPEPMVE